MIFTINGKPFIVDYKCLYSSFSFQGNRKNYSGYNAVVRYKEGFIAAGADGRIDRITISGTVTKSEKFPGEKFNCIISNDKIIVAAGDRGTLLSSDESGIFRNIESNTGENINGLALFRGMIIGVTDHGEIISGDGTGSFKKSRLPLKGNIVSVVVGVTGIATGMQSK